ncbi:MAG: SRPBCC family protein [Sporichthyaceae bacterium]|nr:SRPBCC family protein [Sporichthyaceae bacterium]
MAEVTGHIATTPERVWTTLADGWLYSAWVVGTSKIRAVDAGFPGAGTKIHHAFGVWPALIQDETEVLASQPVQHLLLQARGWPAGEATTAIDLTPSGGGTAIRIAETPTKGPGAWINNPLAEALLKRRLGECCERLRLLVEGRGPG